MKRASLEPARNLMSNRFEKSSESRKGIADEGSVGVEDAWGSRCAGDANDRWSCRGNIIYCGESCHFEGSVCDGHFVGIDDSLLGWAQRSGARAAAGDVVDHFLSGDEDLAGD